MLAKKKRQLGIATEEDLAALERARAHQQSGLFRAVSRVGVVFQVHTRCFSTTITAVALQV